MQIVKQSEPLGKISLANMAFKDCTNHATLVGTGAEDDYNAIFLGYVYQTNKDLELSFENCSNEGSLVCGKAALFMGNLNIKESGIAKLKIDQCSNKGTINATYSNNKYNMNYYAAVVGLTLTINGGAEMKLADLPNAYDGSDSLIANYGKVLNGPLNNGMQLTKNEDGTFSLIGATGNMINGTAVAKYEIGLGLYVRCGSYSSRFYAKESIDATK